MTKRFFTGMATGLMSVALLLAWVPVASADINKGTHLNTSGQTKVNRALARGYQKSGDTDGYTRQQQQSQVNIGSKRAGTCNMNIGSTQPGQKAALLQEGHRQQWGGSGLK